MKVDRRLWLWVAVCYVGTLAVVAGVLVTLGAGLDPDEQAAFQRVLSERAPALGFALILLGFGWFAIVRWFSHRYPQAARRLAEQTRVVLAANPEYRVAADGAPELGEAAHAINQLAEAYHRARGDLEARSAETRAQVEEERNRLAALMSELTEGVLVCNVEGRILLYNERARRLLAAPKGAMTPQYVPLGLGRSVFALLDRDQVAHALDKVQQRLAQGEERPVTRFVASLAHGALARVVVTPFLDADAHVAGMVFTLDDVTGLLGREGQRLALLHSLAAGLRSPVANVRAAAENLVAFPEMEDARRTQFAQIVAAEAGVLSGRLNTAMNEYADALKASLTLEDMSVADLVSVARRRIEAVLGLPTRADAVSEELWVRVDSFAFVQALTYVAGRLRDEYGIREVRLRAQASGGFAALDLVWTGAIVASEALSLWELQPMRIGADETPLTLKDVLERHGGEAWTQTHKPSHSAWFRFLLPLGERVATATPAPAAVGSRPEYYDFDLFGRIEASRELADHRLADLTYTVFDTETTGLQPSAGDEIISIGAVRIVNGRLLKQEFFEQLVNPRRPLDPESARIHGIEARALADQPTIGGVLPAFHRFCEDTVLVAHNAAFDMRFIELKEPASGVRFNQPVLDTLLLSAAVHPTLEDHRLESIAERLGVRVIGRHTALGDALVTAEVFLRLLALLAERGIETLGAALEASRETYYARLRY
ncbi:MAG: exonuclease domain-containing protein [Burkholderiales bacterium]